MDGRAPDPVRKHIDYHLTQLGIRVSEHACQLISHSYEGWVPMGSPQRLPLKVPMEAEDLQEGNILQETAFYIMQRDPHSDLRALLQQEMEFAAALQPQSPEGSTALHG